MSDGPHFEDGYTAVTTILSHYKCSKKEKQKKVNVEQNQNTDQA